MISEDQKANREGNIFHQSALSQMPLYPRDCEVCRQPVSGVQIEQLPDVSYINRWEAAL